MSNKEIEQRVVGWAARNATSSDGDASVAAQWIFWAREREAALLAELEALRKDNARMRFAIHMECTEEDYTYDSELAQAVRDNADLEKAAADWREEVDDMLKERAKERRELEALRAVAEMLAEGKAFKVHDLAMRDSWVIDDVDGVRAALARLKETQA